jgi:hypothetical protein
LSGRGSFLPDLSAEIVFDIANPTASAEIDPSSATDANWGGDPSLENPIIAGR